MAIPLASRTASATVFPMRMVIRPAFRKAEVMEKFSSFDAARRSAMALATFFSLFEPAAAIPLRRTGWVSFSVKALPMATVILSPVASPILLESALELATSFSSRLRFSSCVALA